MKPDELVKSSHHYHVGNQYIKLSLTVTGNVASKVSAVLMSEIDSIMDRLRVGIDSAEVVKG